MYVTYFLRESDVPTCKAILGPSVVSGNTVTTENCVAASRVRNCSGKKLNFTLPTGHQFQCLLSVMAVAAIFLISGIVTYVNWGNLPYTAIVIIGMSVSWGLLWLYHLGKSEILFTSVHMHSIANNKGKFYLVRLDDSGFTIHMSPTGRGNIPFSCTYYFKEERMSIPTPLDKSSRNFEESEIKIIENIMLDAKEYWQYGI